MSKTAIAEMISDLILAHDTDEDRLRAATDLISYSLGAVVALEGPARAAELAYRCGDVVAGQR